MNLYTDTTYAKDNSEEKNAHLVYNDAGLSPSGEYDGIYDLFPDWQMMEYLWPRRLSSSQITEFENWAAANNRTNFEQAFMHDIGFSDSGHRKAAPWGGVPMMLDNTDYLDYIKEKSEKLIKRTWWGAKQTWQIEARTILFDLTHFYPAFDAAQEDVANTEEYNGVTLDYEHPRAYNCVSSLIAVQAHLDSVFGTGGDRRFVVPNYGDILFAAYTDDRTIDLLDHLESIGGTAMLQIMYQHTATDNRIENGRVDSKSATLQMMTETRGIKTMGTFYDATNDPNPSDKGKRLSAGLFYLLMHDNFYVQYRSSATAGDPGVHVDVFEYNPMLKSGFLGEPRGPYRVDGTGRLYERDFARGKVYVWTKEVRTDTSTEKVLTIPSNAYKMNEDGTLSALTPGNYSLWSNDALVMVTRYIDTAKLTPSASPSENWPIATGTPHSDEIDEGILTANDNTFIRTRGKDLSDSIAITIPSTCKVICGVEFGVRVDGVGDSQTTGLEFRLLNDNGQCFALNEILLSEASLVNKQHGFYGLNLLPSQFQNNRVLVQVIAKSNADLTNGKTLVSYVP